MFSVENFYTFFQSHYSWQRTGIMPWIFLPHGSKNLHDAMPFFDKPDLVKLRASHHGAGSLDIPYQIGCMILHDQEPFFKRECISTYKHTMIEGKKEQYTTNWLDHSDEEIFLRRWRTCSWPIFCHSELNSVDVKWLESTGVISCYYFWHGLVARDWFRHWKHHHDLQHKSDWKQRFLLYLRDYTGTRQYRQQVKSRLEPLQDQILCDWQGTAKIPSDSSATIDVSDANNTAIQIVSETVFDREKIHLTEKIFKPMVMQQPFIVFSGANTLQTLRNYGFKTFSSVWDESYDREQDHQKRIDKIISLITYLYNLPYIQFVEILNACTDITEHNRRYFFSDQFEKLLLEELHTNVRSAIDTQRLRSLIDPGGSILSVYHSFKTRNVKLSDYDGKLLESVILSLQSNHQEKYHKIIEKYPWMGSSTENILTHF